jgi:hypothetical protein
VSDQTDSPLDGVVIEIERALEEADLSLQLREEWKNATSFCAALAERRVQAGDDSGAVADLMREAEASRDLLSIAQTEVEQAAEAAQAGREQRLREDERLLVLLEAQGNRYAGLILTSFVLPIFFITYPPISSFVLLALIPSFAGFLRMKAVCDELEGRIWLILQARVDAKMSRIRMFHGAAVGCAVAGLLWFVVALVSSSEAQGG